MTSDSEMSGEPPAGAPPPLDQQPVDQQPMPPRPTGDLPSAPRLPGVPYLPSGVVDGPAMPERPAAAPLIPPLETTSPSDLVPTVGTPPAAAPVPPVDAFRTPPPVAPLANGEPADFVPLRSDSPPHLIATWWLRSALLLSMLAAIGLTMWTEYQGEPGDIGTSAPVRGAHALAALLLVSWSFLAMTNARRIVPASLYKKPSNGPLAVAFWALAAAAPFGTLAVWRSLEDRLADSDDLAAVGIMVAVVLVAFLLLWLPFRYHTRQAVRVGAPHRVMLGWFYAPLLTVVGGISAVAIGLGDLLAEDGLDRSERLIQVAFAYALPMFVFALSTWRAITVFDEVIDIRWRRWRIEWEQTLGSLAALPEPGPEASPNIDMLSQ